MSQTTMPRAKKRNDVPIKIDAEVHRWARIVAAYKNITIAELVSEAVRPLLARELDKMGMDVPSTLANPPKPR